MKRTLTTLPKKLFQVFILILCASPLAAQNVGIGVNAPLGKLTIGDTSRNALTIRTSNNASDAGIAFQNSGNAYVWSMFRSNAGANQAHLVFAGGANVVNMNDLTERMRITNSGRVGIGVTVPGQMLEVAGGIRVGDAPNGSSGTIRWTGDDFEGYMDSDWHSLTKSKLETSGVIETEPFVSPGSYLLTAGQNEETGGSTSPSNPLWQSFTSQYTGKLIEVKMNLFQEYSSLKVRIYKGEGQNGQLLAEENFAGGAAGWNSFTIPDSLPLQKGLQYTIWIQDTIATTSWRSSSQNPYPLGVSGAGNSTNETRDYVFEAYLFTTGESVTIASVDAANRQFTLADSAIVIDSLCRVGVGTGTPNTRLDVAGNINYSGAIQKNGEDLLPIGTIIMWVGSGGLPDHWLICNGGSFPEDEYPELFDLLNSNELPDLKGRFPIGAGTGDAPDATLHVLKSKGGTETHQLTIAEMPSHNHTVSYREGSEGGSGNDYSDLGGPTDFFETTSNRGGNQPHNNMPPFYTVFFIIKAK